MPVSIHLQPGGGRRQDGEEPQLNRNVPYSRSETFPALIRANAGCVAASVNREPSGEMPNDPGRVPAPSSIRRRRVDRSRQALILPSRISNVP